MLQPRIAILFSLLIWAQLNAAGCSVTTLILEVEGKSFVMYDNGQYPGEFISYHSYYTCSLNDLYTYKQTGEEFQNDTPYYIKVQGVTQNTTFAISTEYGIIAPTISPQFCSQDCTIEVRNHCPEVDFFHYFDTIEFKVPGLSTITYNILCNTNFGTSTFEAGQLIIMVISLIVIVLGSIYSRAWTFYKNGIEISYLYIGAYCFLLVVGGILLITIPDVTNIIADVLSWIIGMIGMGVTFNEVMFASRQPIFSKVLISIVWHPIRIMDVVSFFLGLAWMIGWYFSDRNWIITDIIALCIVIAGIKVFKFISLKKALVMLIATTAIEVTFLVLIDELESYSYEEFVLNNLNNPFEIQIPTINPVFGLKCSWVPVSVVLYPAILVSYFRRFDNSRNTKIYLITSSVLFFFGSIVWMVVSVFSPINLPFGLIVEPLMIGFVCLFAYNRKEIRVLWNGKFYDPEFNDKDENENEIEMKNIDESTFVGKEKDSFKQTFLQGLTIDHDEDSCIEPLEPSEIERNLAKEKLELQRKSTIKEEFSEIEEDIRANQSPDPLNIMRKQSNHDSEREL